MTRTFLGGRQPLVAGPGALEPCAALAICREEPVLDEAEGKEDEEWYGEEEEEEEEELADLRAQMRQMEEENQSLRDELSQEQMRVKQLQKLQVEAAQASHREFEAKKREAAASRELEEAKAYVSKRHAFALNEKAELLKQIADLERKLQESSDRELALRLEVQEAIQARTSSSTQQEDFQKEADRWRKDAAEQATRVKAAEQRAQQLEQRKLEDKAKIKALADQLQNATAAGFVADANHTDEKRLQESTKSKVLEASPAATKVSSSKGHNFRGIVNKPLEPRKPAASRPWYRRLAGFCCRRASWAVEMAQACQKQAVVAKPPQKAPKGKRAPAEKAVKSAGTFQAHPEQVDTELRQRAVLALLVVFIACLAVLEAIPSSPMYPCDVLLQWVIVPSNLLETHGTYATALRLHLWFAALSLSFALLRSTCNRLVAERTELRRHEKHLQALESTRGLVDAKQPKEHTHLRNKLKTRKLQEDRAAEIQLENRILLQKMLNIDTKPSQISDAQMSTATRPRSLHGESQRREAGRIAAENQALLQRLQNTKPSIDPRAWDEEEVDRQALKFRLSQNSSAGRVMKLRMPGPQVPPASLA
ncbi:Cfap97d1 [Symbiodinium natans]|uniref:Cfap97d1 protein n=1 Tax=Symbiodinium natans TaxID=878477 RepID=A0A812URN1_9DINO|nr:Cfap97d1 [Symbiodinium natans]